MSSEINCFIYNNNVYKKQPTGYSKDFFKKYMNNELDDVCIYYYLENNMINKIFVNVGSVQFGNEKELKNFTRNILYEIIRINKTITKRIERKR